jgi:tetratricopeptide (TPR) repeat protein
MAAWFGPVRALRMEAMKFPGLFALGLLSLSGAVPAEPLHVDRDKVWFKPALTVNSSPVCADILHVEQDTFFSTNERSNYVQVGWQPIENGPAQTVAGVEIVKDTFGGELILTRPGGERVFTKLVNRGGCGGACETVRILVSGQRFDPSQRVGFDDKWPSTPWAPEWSLYAAPDGEFYALGVINDDRLRAYRLAGPASVELACEVTLKPDRIHNNEDSAIQRAWQSMESLRRAYASVSQGAGSCGSLRAHELRYSYLEQAMQEAMYRPWAADRSWGHSARISSRLEAWALGGIAEYRARQGYLDQVERTIEDIARFYQQRFAWPEKESREQAAAVIHNVLDRGFAFSAYVGPKDVEQPLRRAILEHEPLEAIEQLQLGEPGKEQRAMGIAYDSVLNVAIDYPEALQYLLSKGLDPNVTNAFGKTPLMYAAQFNQLESARILLDAGADPNARTYLPEDECYYTLSTSGMTPLHYAARYASAPMITMLVAHGALTFTKTKITDSEAEEYPSDWLKKYTGNAKADAADEVDINPNIRTAELPALYQVLAIPSEEDRQPIAAKLLARAQAEYAKGEYQPAYRSLQLALSAQPDNERALADLPLVAFKAGEFEEAIKSARRIIEHSAVVPLQASAWFNLGVICEREDVRVRYFREAHCDGDWIMPFMQAWKLQPTRARADKIREIFDGEGADSCSPSGAPQTLKIWSVKADYERMQRIHILHDVGEPLDIEPMPEMTRVIDNLPIQDRAITVLEYPANDAPLKINGQTCRQPSA